MYHIKNKRVFVAGHNGMVGRALLKRLASEGCNLLTIDRRDLDLREQAGVRQYFNEHRPEVVIVAAAKVGGILANSSLPAEFIYDNLAIATNIVETSYQHGVEKLLYLGSSCIYPKNAPQPIPETSLLTGKLEPTNEWYAIAKIAGIKLCQAYRRQHGVDYISAMPTNLYGPGDNYNLESSHVIPALIRKAHEAKLAGEPSMTIWGTGTPMREFLHADDCADALVHLLKVYSGDEHVNVGSGEDMTIEALARLVMDVVGFEGELEKDLSKPDGTPRKLMQADKLRALGWKPKINMREGLEDAYRWFLEHQHEAKM